MSQTYNKSTPRLSLLTAYRGRAEHLRVLLAWLHRLRDTERFTDFELVLVEGHVQPTAEAAAQTYEWVQYLHVPMSGVFHKAVLLNRAAAAARGQYRILLDVDLLPAKGVLAKHLMLASESPRCLVSGYRVQLPQMLHPQNLPTASTLLAGLDLNDESLLCNEDAPLALRENLIDGQRFGVCSCFPAKLFDDLGGLFEGYAGWGCEDQDLIERICLSGLTLVRAYDLLYFHLPHGHEAGWRDGSLIAENKRLFAERRRILFPPHTSQE